MKKKNINILITIIAFIIIGGAFTPRCVNAKVLKKIGRITFMEPLNKAPQGDPFEYEDIKGFSGQIAYTFGKYVVVRIANGGKETSVISLAVENGNITFEVQLSPNGRYVLFKNGSYGDVYDEFHLYYWDLKTNNVFKVQSAGLTFHKTNWSPSGRYIAYCLGGDQNGNQYGVARMNRPLRLYTYDTKTDKSYLIAQGENVIGWVWTDDNALLYGQTEQDRKWVDGQENNIDTQKNELANTYKTSPDGKTSKLVIEDHVPRAISPNGSKILVFGHYNPDKPVKNQEKPSNGFVGYGYPFIYDVQSKKLTALKNIFLSSDIRFLNNNELLLSQYDYFNKVGTLTIKRYNIHDMSSDTITRVQEKDVDSAPNRISYQPQFGLFRLSDDKLSYFFSSRHDAKILGVQSTGAVKIISPAFLNKVNIVTANKQIVCNSTGVLFFSWSSLYKGVTQ